MFRRWTYSGSKGSLNGTIVEARVVDGTYYAEASTFGFDPNFKSAVTDSPINVQRSKSNDRKKMSSETNDPEVIEEAMSESQGYITQLATRALIFIESDNPDIGLMCFVGVGMVEVSTCDITVKMGPKVKKGDELGMFHFGGSSHCLIFQPDVELDFDLHGQTPGVNTNAIPINCAIAKLTGKSSNKR